MTYKRKDDWGKWRDTPAGMWYGFVVNNRRRKRHEVEMNRDEFIKWYTHQPKECYYCGIKLEDIPNMKVVKTKRLTIDRRDNDGPYSISNIVLACFRCNMVKGFVFSEEEMLEIAQKYLIGRL